jgi:hypothetical protein
LKMKAVCASETSASTCKSTWRYNADDWYRYIYRRENLKSWK